MTVVNLTLARALRDYVQRRSRVLLIEVNAGFRFLRARGDVRHYGLARLQVLEDLTAKLHFLHGLNARQPVTLSFVEVRPGVVADVHIVPAGDSSWVLFFDVLEAYERERKLQQRTHETLLLNDRLKAMLSDLRQTQAELQRSSLELKQANDSKARLIASFGHELRTPLTAILGFAAHVKPRAAADPVLEHGIAAVERGGEHLLNLIDNLLDASVLELGQFKLSIGATDIRQLLGEVADLLSPLASNRGLSISLELDASLPTCVLLDAARTRQILINILGNAIKFTERGGVILCADYRDGALQISVIDTGTGIDPSFQKALFQPFARSTHTSVRGTGLGLSISRALSEAHGGSLHLKESSAQGTTFLLVLPAERSVELVAVRDSLALRSTRTILICDDDADVLALLVALLTDAGFHVESCHRGEDFLEQCHALKPNLVLLDLNLADLTGFDCIRRLRAAGEDVPAIALSADNRGDVAQAVVESGFVDFLLKPLQVERLIHAVDQWSR